MNIIYEWMNGWMNVKIGDITLCFMMPWKSALRIMGAFLLRSECIIAWESLRRFTLQHYTIYVAPNYKTILAHKGTYTYFATNTMSHYSSDASRSSLLFPHFFRVGLSYVPIVPNMIPSNVNYHHLSPKDTMCLFIKIGKTNN